MRHTLLNNQYARIALLGFVLIAISFVTLPAMLRVHGRPDADGTIILEVFQARAVEEDDDTFFGPIIGNEQDFFFEASVNGGPKEKSPIIEGRDWATWVPPFTVSATVPMDTLIVPIKVSLFDDDNTSGTDHFDINQQPGRDLDLFFNTCTLRLERSGISLNGPDRHWFPPGLEDDAADVEIRVLTGDGKPFSPNDVAIANATPVQTVFNPRNIIADKGTAFMVDFTSSWSVSRNVLVTVEMSDGISNVSETKIVNVPPSGLRVFFFDGSGTAGPYFPIKNSVDPNLTFSVTTEVEGEPPIVPEPPWFNCTSENNAITNASLPVIETVEHRTVYLAWDWDAAESVVSHPSPSIVNLTRNSNETFRKGIFPVANAPSARFPGTITSPATFLEPFPTLASFSIGAMSAGIDHLVLMPRSGWFASNADRLTFCTPAIGCSLGSFHSHAVIAEANSPMTTVHELGHAHRLSQHSCSTGGLLEDIFGLGCRDEYTHAPADGAPYIGNGYDVEGNIFPTGSMDAPDGTRQVRAINFMDAATAGLPPFSFDRWIDKFTYDFLSEELRAPQDPELVNVTGFVESPSGLNATSVFSGTLYPAFQFFGIPDMEELAYNEPSGHGVFAVHLVTAQGSRIYRFTPEFTAEGTDTGGVGAFSFSVPWDQATEQIALYGPSNLGEPQQNQDVLLFSIDRTAASPTVNTLIADINPPNLLGPRPQPPTIPSNHDIFVAWDGADLDSQNLNAFLLLDPPPYNDEDVGWVPVGLNIEGNQFTIPANSLFAPGLYKARLLISDGINSVTYDIDHLFTLEANVVYLPLIVHN
ncbi:MAG: hypothetical protein DWQ04_12065 [Chloroflexi bacterium]|nr:MAG: hypothetical protein DWQ04_12065 [Chloroflexota bacterium]